MAIYGWDTYPATQYTAVMLEGCPFPAIKDVGCLYYTPVTFDPDTGAPMYIAWMRADQNAANCYESETPMTVQQFMDLPFSDTQP